MKLGLNLDLCNSFQRISQFTPADISNLELWLDATDAGTISLRDSTYVTGWNDKSGQGNHFTQTTEASQPIMGTNEIDFAGSLKHLIAGSNYIFSENNGLSILTLAKSADAGALSRFIFDFGLNYTAGYGLSYTSIKSFFYTPPSLSSANLSSITDYIRLAVIITFEDTQKLYRNNVYQVATSEAIPGLVSLTAANIAESPTLIEGVSGPMTIGKASANTLISRDYQDKVKEILVYTKALSLPELTQLDNYLAAIP